MPKTALKCKSQHSQSTGYHPSTLNLALDGQEEGSEGRNLPHAIITSQKALYGRISLLREMCPECNTMAIIVKGKFTCCDREWNKKPITSIKRMVGGTRRKQLSRVLKEWILHLQRNKCFYCDIDLDNSWYIRSSSDHPMKVRTHFDHIVPWVFSMNDDVSNFVAACSACNHIKRDRIFDSVESLVKWVLWKRDVLGIQSI